MERETGTRKEVVSNSTVKERFFDPLRFSIVSFSTSLRTKPVDRYPRIYQAIARQPEDKLSLNREEQLLPEFLKLVKRRGVTLGTLFPYWSSERPINPLEIFGTLLQFSDYHELPLPKEVYPPEKDVREYVDRIMHSDGRVTIPQQFEHLLDITDNNLLGAIHLGFVASRLMARGLESRAYPSTQVGETEMFAWNDKVTQFEKYSDLERNDAPGDTYYFWTHMLGAVYYKIHEGLGKSLYNFAFEHGTEMMRFIRKWSMKAPTNASHHEPTLLGRQIGFALVEHLSDKAQFDSKNLIAAEELDLR